MARQPLLAVLLCAVIFICVPVVHAQYFKFDNAANDQQIKDEVEGILKYFSSLVGGGMFHTADLHDFGGVDIGLTGTLSTVPSKFEGLPVFSEENLVGLAFLNASIGLPGNFELIGRFFYLPVGSSVDQDAVPVRSLDSRGGVTLIGGGLKYGLLQMPGVPKIMIMGTFHSLTVPDEFDFGNVSTISFKGVISHSFPLITLFVGAGIDITRLELDDAFLNGDSFTETLPNATVGARVQVLPLVHVNAAYNFSEFASFAFGAGLSIR
ncbi:MAG: DUF6588 family protein [bacterium]